MTFNPNKPCETKDGRPVRILCTDKKGAHPIVALVPFKNGVQAESILSYDTEGRWCAGNNALDLVNVVERTSQWRNLWKKPGTSYDYDTREEAERTSLTLNKRIGLLELRYEDGSLVDVIFHKVSE